MHPSSVSKWNVYDVTSTAYPPRRRPNEDEGPTRVWRPHTALQSLTYQLMYGFQFIGLGIRN